MTQQSQTLNLLKYQYNRDIYTQHNKNINQNTHQTTQ